MTKPGDAKPSVTPPAKRTFPTEGTSLWRVATDPQFRESFHANLKWSNPMVVALYRAGVLPLLGVGRQIMLITTRGRKTGKLRHFPVGYFRIGGGIHVFSGWGKRANWYRNLLAAPDDVSITIGFHRVAASAHVLDDPAEIERTLEQFVTESPSDAHRLIGWDSEKDRLGQADFSGIINNVTIVKFLPKET